MSYEFSLTSADFHTCDGMTSQRPYNVVVIVDNTLVNDNIPFYLVLFCLTGGSL